MGLVLAWASDRVHLLTNHEVGLGKNNERRD